MSTRLTILIVEDQPLLRIGLKLSLEMLNRYDIVGEAADGESAISATHKLLPQLVLMDVGLPIMDGIEATWRIKQELPRTRVVMFTSHTAPNDVTAALGAGADGYCAKDTSIEQLASAIDTVMRGEVWLDPTIADSVVRGQTEISKKSGIELSNLELQVLTLIKHGLTSKDLALRLNTSTETVSRVMHEIIHRFVAKTTAEVVRTPKKGFSSDWFTSAKGEVSEGAVFADKYEVKELLGSGATGSVFKAKHLYMDRTVALKFLRPPFSEDPLAMRNFQREATAIAALQHRNIIGVYDFGISEDGEPFLVMEYVAGRDLASILAESERLSVQRVLNLCVQVCSGLAEANSKDITHCDLKPSNIMILGTEPNEVVKLADFGLAQIIVREPTHQSQSTDKFVIQGTPIFMSPEQISGKQVDSRSDIYSLGCVMFVALTGVNACHAETVMETLAKHLEVTAPTINAAYPKGNFPHELEQIVAKMLEKDAADRPQSMDEVVRGLLSILYQVR